MIEIFMTNIAIGFFAIATANALFKPTKEAEKRDQDELDFEHFDISDPLDLLFSLFAVVFWFTCWPYYVYLRIKDSK